ncbi:MAG: hypothetical protein ACFFE8_07005 [Candidatus Heimdallarchaeota archaeon]
MFSRYLIWRLIYSVLKTILLKKRLEDVGHDAKFKTFKNIPTTSIWNLKMDQQTLLVQINQAKQDLYQTKYDNAIKGFIRAIEISRKISPNLSGIIGICHAYLAVAYGKIGERQESLENITLAEAAFSNETKNPSDYAKIIRTIGKELQDMMYFDSSIIGLRLALKLARNYEGEGKLDLVSIISRDLGFSYMKVGNHLSAAKLFRISGDLEDDDFDAVNLYQNAAYLYYQENKRNKALNTLETAFNKAGIIGKLEIQQEIAQFQSSIAYDLFRESQEKESFETAMAYCELCLEKLEFLGKMEWIVRIRYEQALTYSQLGQRHQSLQLLSELALKPPTVETEEYIIKANILMTIYSLESDKYGEATFYIRQISESQFKKLEETRPELTQKLEAIRAYLKRLERRGQISTNIRFSRKKLDLPLEDLLNELEPVPEDQQVSPDLKLLQAPILEVTPPVAKPSHTYQSPTIETLQELFKSTEISQNGAVHPVTPTISPKTPPVETPAYIDRTRLFKAHQTKGSPKSIEQKRLTSITRQEQAMPEYSPTIDMDSTSQTLDKRTEVITRLQRAGWSIRVNFTDSSRRTAEPDLIAEKGLIRKTRRLVFFAEDPTDAEICSFLLQSSQDSGQKIIFLLTGDPLEANISLDVKIFTQIDQFF